MVSQRIRSESERGVGTNTSGCQLIVIDDWCVAVVSYYTQHEKDFFSTVWLQSRESEARSLKLISIVW